MKKDYVDTSDFSKEELLDIAELGILIKRNLKAGFPLMYSTTNLWDDI